MLIWCAPYQRCDSMMVMGKIAVMVTLWPRCDIPWQRSMTQCDICDMCTEQCSQLRYTMCTLYTAQYFLCSDMQCNAMKEHSLSVMEASEGGVNFGLSTCKDCLFLICVFCTYEFLVCVVFCIFAFFLRRTLQCTGCKWRWCESGADYLAELIQPGGDTLSC